jgi:phosphohistidine phosphatase
VGTRRLTLLRHGQAQPPDAFDEDFERPLTRRGVIEAEEMGKRLLHRNLLPDTILVSPADRAWATAEIVAGICELAPDQIQCARELYLASRDTIWRLLMRCEPPQRHVLVCGHNPGLSQLASRLGPKPQLRTLATAGLATAVWNALEWAQTQPETAASCELDDPESMADLWA